MNMLARWRRNDPDYIPLDLDEGFEEDCRQSLQEPMQTPTERLREAQENILTVLRDKDAAHDRRIQELRKALSDEEDAKLANLEEMANVERSYAALSVTPSKPKSKKAREVAQ